MNKWLFPLFAILCGIWFFASLDRLWPLLDVDLHRDRAKTIAEARAFMESQGFDLSDYEAAARLRVEMNALDFLERQLSRDAVQDIARRPLPLVRYQVFFRKRDAYRTYSFSMHPDGTPLAFGGRWLEEAEGARLERPAAQALSQSVFTTLDIQGDWRPRGVDTTDLRNRRRHTFTYERELANAAGLRERLYVTIEGDVVAGAIRSLIVPEAARLQARADRAPVQALQTIGFILLGAAGLAAIIVFLQKLQAGQVHLRQAAILAVIVFVTGLVTQLLQSAAVFLEWDPLWPRWISFIQSMFYRAGITIQIFLLVLVLAAVGDAVDRNRFGGERGESLRRLVRGRFFHPSVAQDAGRGFLLGLICGAALTLAAYLPDILGTGHVALQPRGFFFYTLNAASPALATILFFTGIALIEECGYRYFGGSWLLALTGKKWLAIWIPALIYGLTHTYLDFLPPAEPYWMRPIVLTLVGAVWGWGFLRFGALTVIISHFTADLFIFNWPRLASGEPQLIAIAVATIAVPLIPLLGHLFPRSRLSTE